MVVVLISSILAYLTALVVVDAAPIKRDGNLPDFVLKYAPLTYLHTDEQYWPSDVAIHLLKVIPEVDFKPVGGSPTLQTLSTFANNVDLTAIDDVLAHDTEFFRSTVGKPVDGVSIAPATIIVVEKPGGITDAFYFYFYGFNLGNAVLGLRFAHHGRFVNGIPDIVYYSEHSGGSAYTYSAVEKSGDRPITYAGIGTHANYATSGDHEYSLPFGLLKDQTNKGPTWDITKNFRGFWYTPSNGVISVAPGAGIGGTVEPTEGGNWLNFGGLWGDQKWPTTRFGQYCLGNECHISDGPSGPLSKNLGRTTPCQDESSCSIGTSL
ncbi:hypothetical protein BDM02DRAFT_3156054 [Thelephora ganbajun]|uniref:Uncharacterized protein n=1 Tax=Thelephora ganbajun TaxID=370292 RepID=A0ACB6ZER9_THEGA|nr:hypothetical protein BDM02DRAFT_3156054 [Thelephora ganbajun]